MHTKIRKHFVFFFSFVHLHQRMKYMIELPTYSGRIILRAIEEADADAIFSYRSLEEIAKYQYWEPFNKEQSVSFAKRCSNIQLDKKDEWIGLAIIAEGRFIGDCSLKVGNSFAEVGCNISPLFQGCGYAKEALKALFFTAFNHLSINCVIGITDSENKASIKLMEASGMMKTSGFENHIICKNKKCVEHKYSIQRTDWNNINND